MPLKILIVGAGIGGPALAYALRRTNPEHSITVIDHYPELRTSGQQVDLRGQGVSTMRNLGLLDKMKDIMVEEEGICIVDTHGKAKATFRKSATGTGKQSFTSEYEFMRGDLVKLLYDASLKDYSGKTSQDGSKAKTSSAADGKGVHYEFNKSITELTQDDSGVDVTFSDGAKGRYDLVVGADGQWSRTRKLLLGAPTSDAAFHSLGLFVAYYTMPRAPGDDSLMKMYLAPGSRGLTTRLGRTPDTTQAYMGIRADPAALAARCGGTPFVRLAPARQKEVLADALRGAGWQAERFERAARDAPDFYAHEIGQVRLPPGCLARGRVALLGDAGYCPSAMTGMGTTLALLGAYVLAGEIAGLGADAGAADVPRALEAYERTLRPYVHEIQKITPGVTNLFFPSTSLGIFAMHKILGLVETFRIDKLIMWLMPEDKGGLPIPEYPEIRFGA
ncbi:hypothetical protein F5X96DRAFT_657757 [Biscogniauxia mediterranea]|nr:hypothetical protein F5X96DRAFT_657757 [Biscogniauxia mediterranea]